MKIQEIDAITFDSFAKTHIMKNFYQTSSYAKIMEKTVFEVMYIGMFEENIMRGAALILYKFIAPGVKYGYSPRGFLIDYYNKNLLYETTKKLKEFFFRKGFAFIKINPEITYSILDYNNKNKEINSKNRNLTDFLAKIGYKKLGDNLNFESLLTKFNPIINLTTYDMTPVNKILDEKVTENERKSLRIILGEEKDLETFYSFFANTKIKNLNKFKLYYNVFKEKNMVDLFLIETDYNEMIKALQRDYYIATVENNKLNEEFKDNFRDIDAYNKKMASDKKLNDIHHNIVSLTNTIQSSGVGKEIVAGALLVKYEGRVNVILANFKKEFHEIDIKFYLYYKIIEEYKKAGYRFVDLNGISGDFSEESQFKKLNEFKLQFNPTVYEYIGELDLITNIAYYQLLTSTGMLKKEFNREDVK